MRLLFDQLIKDKQSREAKPQQLSAALKKSACLETVYLFSLAASGKTNKLFIFEATIPESLFMVPFPSRN